MKRGKHMKKTHEENNTYSSIWFIDGGWSTNGD